MMRSIAHMPRHKQGILYMLLASFFFALTGACARYLKDEIPPIQLVLCRNLIGVLFICFSLWRRPAIEQGGKMALLVFRGITGTLALYTFFYGISTMGLAIAITYQQSYPIFLALAGMFVYGDRLVAREWLAIFLGFTGICFIFLPSLLSSHLTFQNHLIGLGNAVMTGLAYLSIRGLSQYYDERSIIVVFMLSGIVMPLISLSAGQILDVDSLNVLIARPVMPGWVHLPALMILGLAALAGQIYLTRAFSFQKTGVIGAVGFSNVVFSILFGTLLGDAFPSFLSILGIALVVLCGIWLSVQQKKAENSESSNS